MFRKIFYTAAAALWIAGCAQQPGPAETPRSEPVVIEGKRWQLVSFGTHEMRVPQKAWIELSNGRYQGFAGCNGLSGTYTKSGQTIRFTMDPSTQMACPDMRGETEFRKRLLKVRRFALGDGLLTLKGEKENLLVFMESEAK
jgi:heat shock protein HslJ